MAITLKTYFKKCVGLPSFSSVSCAAEVEVEINNVDDIPQKIQELYETLQSNVDLQLQNNPGFMAPDNPKATSPAQQQTLPHNVTQLPPSQEWRCSIKQKELIQKLVDEKNLAKTEIEQLANDLFSKGVKSLNKLEASGLIERLFNIPSPAGKKVYKQGGKR